MTKEEFLEIQSEVFVWRETVKVNFGSAWSSLFDL